VVVASKSSDAGIAIAQKDNVNVLLGANASGGYLGTTSNHPFTLGANRNYSVVVGDKDVSVKTRLKIHYDVIIGYRGTDRIISFLPGDGERRDGGTIEYTPTALRIAGAGAVDPQTKKDLPRKITLSDDVTVNGELFQRLTEFPCAVSEDMPFAAQPVRIHLQGKLKDLPPGTMALAKSEHPQTSHTLWIGWVDHPNSLTFGYLKIEGVTKAQIR
jgi:hypothetical protein